MDYSTKNKTIDQVIKDTRKIIARHKTKNYKEGDLYYIKKYQDCTAIIANKTNNKFYVNCLSDIYGPFEDLETCIKFRKILNLKFNALRQAEVNSWSREGAGFLGVENAFK